MEARGTWKRRSDENRREMDAELKKLSLQQVRDLTDNEVHGDVVEKIDTMGP